MRPSHSPFFSCSIRIHLIESHVRMVKHPILTSHVISGLSFSYAVSLAVIKTWSTSNRRNFAPVLVVMSDTQDGVEEMLENCHVDLASRTSGKDLERLAYKTKKKRWIIMLSDCAWPFVLFCSEEG